MTYYTAKLKTFVNPGLTILISNSKSTGCPKNGAMLLMIHSTYMAPFVWNTL